MKTIAVAYGDGIGPEIMKAVLRIMKAAGADLQYEEVKIGKEVYLSGQEAGIDPSAWELFRKHGVFLKAPITTPQGGGYKSLNVTIRKTMGLFANVRPVKAYTPFVDSHFPTMDVVVVRENEEDLYAGIEHQQTTEVIQCLKILSKPGSEAIIRYAFEYAKAHGRKKVTCMSKDNIMKLSDGMFHDIFNRISEEYPGIESEHWIIDIGSALLADQPERFDVVVTLNLYGDIISDITAQVAGSVGLGGSANVGETFAMFEAIHGSAPDIAGKGIANPSGLLNGACMMLIHLGMAEVAAKIQNALMCTLEDGIHTGDIYTEGMSRERVGTEKFADALIERLGNIPKKLKEVAYNHEIKPIQVKRPVVERMSKSLVGVDVFIDWNGENGVREPATLGAKLETLAQGTLKLKVVTNRGQKVYPGGLAETYCTDHWPCRFAKAEGGEVAYADVLALLQSIYAAGLDVIKTENLYDFENERAYSLSQGE